MSDELKPCPFCGSDDVKVCEGSPYASDPDRATYRAVCGHCGASPAGAWTVTESRSMWNCRLGPPSAPLPDDVREAVERLEYSIEGYFDGHAKVGIDINALRTVLTHLQEKP